MKIFESRVLKIYNNKIAFSLLVNLGLFLLVYFFLSPLLKLDDLYVMFAASGFYTGEPSEYLLVSNVILGKILAFLYNSASGINWYTWMLVSMNFICMSVLLYLILKRAQPLASLITFLLLFLAFGIEFYFRIHYTYIAFLCGFTGLYLVLFSEQQRKVRLQAGRYLLAIFLFIMAFLIRKESFLGIFAFTFLIIIFQYIKNKSSKSLIVLGLVVVIGLSLTMVDRHYYTKNVGTDYNKYLEAQYVLNAENKIPHAITPEILNDFGFTENDLSMLSSWFWVDESVFSQETLIGFASRIERHRTLPEMIDYLWNRILLNVSNLKYFLMFLAIMILMLTHFDTRRFLLITVVNVLAIALGLLIFRNLPDRVIRPVWYLIISINLLYFLYHENLTEVFYMRKLKLALILILSLASLTGLAHVVVQNQYSIKERYKFSGIIQEINGRKYAVFVFPTLWELAGYPAYRAPVHYSCRNIIISDWFTYSPVYNEILDFHGIRGNIMHEFLDNDKLLLVSASHLADVITRFYLEHHQECVKVIPREDYKNIDVVSITRCEKSEPERVHSGNFLDQ